MKRVIVPCLLALFSLQTSAQTDSTIHSAISSAQSPSLRQSPPYPQSSSPSIRSLIIPVTFIAYGSAALSWSALKTFDQKIQRKVWIDNPHRVFNVDYYLPYTPAVAVYVLNWAGIKGWHDFRDRSVIYVLANAFAGATVFSLKAVVHSSRPDGSGNDGCPSAHTAAAFAAAEFMRQEFKDRSVWYGIAGYTAAAGTAFFRVYNNRHWFSQTVAGAGIGILTAKASYWLFPWIDRNFLPARKQTLIQN